MISVGTQIRFLKQIAQTHDHYTFVFCEENDVGSIVDSNKPEENEFRYAVLNNNWPRATFLCNENDFEVLSNEVQG